MSGYFANFIIYTAAMVGIIFLALFVYKKTAFGSQNNRSNFLAIEDTLNIGPRKSIYVVRAGNEKFLIASDAERTTLLSELKNKKTANEEIYTSSVDDLPVIVDFPSKKTNDTVFRKILKNI